MVSLKKPESCECGSFDLRKETKPERWICNNCESVVVQRCMRPAKGICRDCGARKNDVEFVSGKNLCKTCKSKHNASYRKENRERVNAKQKEWQEKNYERYHSKIKENIQKDMLSWLRSRMGSIKRVKLSQEKGRGQSRNPARQDVQIDLDYLMESYEAQDGKCALSGLTLTHEMDCHFSASVDRKDGSIGYVPGNVQLVCKAVNMAKGNSSDESIQHFFDAFFVERCKKLVVGLPSGKGVKSLAYGQAIIDKLYESTFPQDPVFSEIQFTPGVTPPDKDEYTPDTQIDYFRDAIDNRDSDG